LSETYTLHCLSRTVSPTTHMAGSEGNESIVAREAVVTPRGIAKIPFLSGNAIRHRAVREPGWRWLIGEWGLEGKLSLPQLNFLLHGGSLTEGGGKENTKRIADWHRLFPLGKLLGGCLPSQILTGSVHCWRGTLVCEENRQALGDWPIPDRLRPAEEFVTPYQYTRGDVFKLALVDAAAESASNQMIFNGQAVCRGAAFVHGFVIRHGSPLELGALLWSLKLWLAGGGTVGGQAARGHGRIALSLANFAGDVDGLCESYKDHSRTVREEAVAWLAAAFATKAEKPATPEAKPKRGERTKS